VLRVPSPLSAALLKETKPMETLQTIFIPRMGGGVVSFPICGC
jgi:hypothetical protein